MTPETKRTDVERAALEYDIIAGFLLTAVGFMALGIVIGCFLKGIE